ncbi:hypothetical protein [Pseudonocardia spirodelae]|uniref:Uncharacterized protein n=1 Tax=Pseudonocardia spirodelae TaxID=3133431 RepID=A0ABU8TDK7_9PSEU
MQLGSFTLPPLPAVAVLGAGVLVVLVLWGVWRVRRTPAPAPLPLEPPRSVADPQPSHADWTGEAAGGPADPPPPARARTVADAVAERGADTGPLPRVPAVVGASAASAAGRHAAPEPDAPEQPDALSAPADERPDAATLARAAAAPLPAPRPTPRPRPRGAERPDAGAERSAADTDDRAPAAAAPSTTGATATTGTAADATDTDGDRPEPAWPPAPPADTPDATGDATGDADRPSPDRPVARLRIVDDLAAPADPSAQAPAEPGDTTQAEPTPGPLPPWSAERAEPAAEDQPASAGTGAADPGPEAPSPEPATPPSGSPPARVTPEPVSRAVQQALAARAVQRARLRQTEPEVDPTGEQQERPPAVVPTAAAPVTGGDARDRLLGVLLADPARAVDATERLDDSRDRIAELGEVLRRRRDDLAGAVRHLHECGLDPGQIGRLSGMAAADVRTILDGEDAGR